MKLWQGRFQKKLNEMADDFNASISFDYRMYREDIEGSIAHATMLGEQGIISSEDKEAILRGLKDILQEIDSGTLEIDFGAEDIHMFVEEELTKRIGDAGKRLHTARSRNDQVALDLRMYCRNRIGDLKRDLEQLIHTLLKKSEENLDTIMPGYTHLQVAQPVTFAHHLMAYVQMFLRDLDRLKDCYRRVNVMPLGSGALATTTHPIQRHRVQELLNFSKITENSMDAVSDRDFVVELCSDLSLMMTHLSRFSEEIILWSSTEFKFVELDDSFSTGSSIMPQKKNPDMAELIRGKTGRVYGNLMGILTTLKGIPLAYNKDMQEDKEGLFDSLETVSHCLQVMAPMIETMTVQRERMRNAAARGFINATDCADYLAKKGVPFRDAYKATGELVAYCIEEGKTLETLTLEEYREKQEAFDEGIYDAIRLETCVAERKVPGGPAPKAVKIQIENGKETLKSLMRGDE